MAKVFSAKVKSVLSSDTLILTPLNGSNQERIFSLAHLQAPRVSSNEKYAFEARELLRTLLVGKQVNFWVLYKNNSGREFGDVSSPVFSSLIEYILSKGAAKLRDNVNVFDDEELMKLKDIETKAKNEEVGLWSPNVNSIELIQQLSEKDIEKSKSQQIPAIVEKVISGDRVILRFLLSKTRHAVIPVLLAGVRSPRTASDDQPGEPFANESKNFVESRLLAKDVQVSIIGESSSGVLVGKILHPAGNISEKILQEGLAEVADWQSSILGASGMSILRKAEKSAKLSGKNKWKDQNSSNSAKGSISAGDSTIEVGKTLPAVVSRIISSDTLVLSLKNDSEITVQLASLRAPRQSDASLSAFVPAAREFVRSKLIGKQIKFTIESIRPKTDTYDERIMATVKSNDGKNFSELVVANGYASVIRHKKGDDVPEYWDLLVESENQAIKAKKGIHGKVPEHERVVDASENSARAKPYLFSFQNRNKISGIVEHVIAPNRFKISIPRESLRLTLVLGGLANTGHRDDPLSKIALDFVSKKVYQREVNFDIYGTDKTGGFIGNLYVHGAHVPFQTSLLSNGFAQCHERSVSQTKFGSQLLEAESEAKAKRIGVWSGYDPSKEDSEEDLVKQVENLKIDKKYYDVKVSEVSPEGLVSFQYLNEEQKKLHGFMQKFHAASSTLKPLPKAPKVGEFVAAKFSDNGKYYRAKVLAIDRATNKYKVQHIDYGTLESISSFELRTLPSEFQLSVLKPQAHTVQLSLISLPAPTEYNQEAIYLLEDLVLDKQLVACETFKNPASGIEMDVELYDPDTISKDPTWTINKELVKLGFAVVKKKNLAAFEILLKDEQKALLAIEEEAKRTHTGCWEFGDIEGDDELA